MKLSDIVGAAHGLAIYAEIGLALFVVAFVAIVVQLVAGRHADEWERARSLPLSNSEHDSARGE